MSKMTERGATRHEMGKQNGDDSQYEKMIKHHHKTQWIYWTVALLGFWIFIFPLTFDYSVGVTQPAGGRSVWLALSTRISILKWSDIVSGILLIILGLRTVKPDRPIELWIACFIGVWLNAAPLIFWAPSASIYATETFVGTFIVALTILIPGMPNMINYMKMGPEVPPGWSFNPSSWAQRSILIFLGFGGWMISRYLAAYQLGYIDQVWDPFFGSGSHKVLTSQMSEMWPISDGGLGAFSYTFEFLMGWMGSPSRWRTMPWMVTIFGILVIPLGLMHIFLVISQPVIVGHWCTFCLLAALFMLPMIPLEVDEVIAMIQFLKKSKKDGKSMWKVFWIGDTIDGASDDERSPKIPDFYKNPKAIYKASLWGFSIPKTLIFSTLIGLWIIIVPGLFGHQKPAADIEHLAGALIITTSVISMGEVIRSIRFINVLIGIVMIAGALFFSGYTTFGMINDILFGIFVIALAIPKGKILEKYDTWNSKIK